jgi:2-polyprenyl-6-methoxyphenol hydroxylase-like FAD-dependent oxidoreductase
MPCSYSTIFDGAQQALTGQQLLHFAIARSPVLGQGVNMALTDSMLLSDSISRASSLKEALEQYSDIRKDPLRFYQWVSLMANPWFQSSRIPMMAFARDNFFATGM